MGEWQSRLLKTVAHDESCVRLIRNWAWYLGHEVMPSDFDAGEIRIYLESLRDEVSPQRLMEMKVIIETLWLNGFEGGLIPNAPREIK